MYTRTDIVLQPMLRPNFIIYILTTLMIFV